MTTGFIQETIFENTGIKTSVKKGTGSTKGYFIFSPILQDGKYPNFPFDFYRELLSKYPGEFPKENFGNSTQLSFYGLKDERFDFKKERKPKSIEEKKAKTWGSKNSQLRLDKASARYAKKLRKGNVARYS